MSEQDLKYRLGIAHITSKGIFKCSCGCLNLNWTGFFIAWNLKCKMNLATLRLLSLSGTLNMQQIAVSKRQHAEFKSIVFLSGFCWSVHEEVLKQWCSENHYSDTNPQLRHEILEAGSLRSNTQYTVLQNTPLPSTSEFSLSKTAAHQLFFQKNQKGKEGGK